MPTLPQLAQIMIAARVTTAEAWQHAAKVGGNDFAATLDALAETPAWWADGDERPTLTDYQRNVIELWWEDGKAPLHRQLALNHFLVLKKLGQGGQGEVYLARQLNPKRFVAIKTLTQDSEARRVRFEQEAKAMMRVQHPGVARFYLYERVRDSDGKPTDEYVIAMEYAEGTDLYRIVTDSGPPPWQYVARWAVDVLGGLAVIHKNGFIHRDVKPANIMAIGPIPGPGSSPVDAHAKLLDFGAAKQAADVRGPVIGQKRIFVGTREYAPPEQWNESVVPASDVYALGASLFHALAGRAPYEVEGRDAMAFVRAHTTAPIPDVCEFNPNVPEQLSELLTRMMSKKAEDRSTAEELAGEFRSLLPAKYRPPADAPPPPPKPTSSPAFRLPPPPPPPEERGGGHAILHPILLLLERVYLPAEMRAQPGEEPATSERIAALVRRPLLLLTLLVLVGVLIVLIR